MNANTHHAEKERQAFSTRLNEALMSTLKYRIGRTDLMRHFNHRHKGGTITVHSARKWLVGEAVPSMDKVQTLAEWLGVKVEWLRFGTGPMRNETVNDTEMNLISTDALMLWEGFSQLNERDQLIIRATINAMITNKEKKDT